MLVFQDTYVEVGSEYVVQFEREVVIVRAREDLKNSPRIGRVEAIGRVGETCTCTCTCWNLSAERELCWHEEGRGIRARLSEQIIVGLEQLRVTL